MDQHARPRVGGGPPRADAHPWALRPGLGPVGARRAYVAGEVLDLAERHGSLRRLQSAVLIPLELELATRADINTWRPGPWVATLTTALGDHKRAWDRQAKARSRRTRDG
jgi:hypothetical protein